MTELGKLIDPFADKLTQGALILCFVVKYQYMRYLLALYVLKEGFMLVAGLVILRHNGRKLNGAKWFGKVSTALVTVPAGVDRLNSASRVVVAPPPAGFVPL